ncbi:hypothetical protein LG293_17245 (plasmid) [Citricoccus nitrophenolicus]
MATISIDIEHEGTGYTGKIGTITKTTLGVHEHFNRMTYDLQVNLGGGLHASVGGYGMEARTGSGINHLRRILETVGAADWEHLAGSPTMVLFDPETETSVGLASLDGRRVFILADHAKQFADAAGSGRTPADA